MILRAHFRDRQPGRWLLFEDPVETVEVHDLAEVVSTVERLARRVEDEGLFAAGFLAYEAAPAFDPALRVLPNAAHPLLSFGLFRAPVVTPAPAASAPYALGPWRPSVSRERYADTVAHIRRLIASGDTYQLNYTVRLRSDFSGDPSTLFADLVRAQRPDHAAYVETGAFTICSVSPELFFERDGDRLTTRPMKGTAVRGRFVAEDEEFARRLRHSEKNRAENVMIVDMIRNDLGRVASTGSVRVSQLCAVERYPTVWQMTSTIEARSTASAAEVIAALFPCASITGAPKVRTMQLITDVEDSPRGIYTGAIGYLAPQRRARFGVAIRTVTIDRERRQAEYGVGGGVVWDSDNADEYAECMHKARVLSERRPDFELLETMLWRPQGGYFLLAAHLRRLQGSADYFGFPLDLDAIRERLAQLVATPPAGPARVRLLLAEDGGVTVGQQPLGQQRAATIGLARTPVDSQDPFLFHKTTHRAVYAEARASRPDCDEVLLWNERGELTEGTIANVVFRFGGDLVTPPLTCGLLPGTMRAHLLERGAIRERVVTRAELSSCDGLFLVNSVTYRRSDLHPGLAPLRLLEATQETPH